MHTIAYQKDIVPNYPGNVMAARADRLKGQSRREVERFVSAWLRGAAYASDPANREAAVAILGHYGQTPEGAGSSIEGVTLNARPDRDHLIVPWSLRQEFGLSTPEGTVDNISRPGCTTEWFTTSTTGTTTEALRGGAFQCFPR